MILSINNLNFSTTIITQTPFALKIQQKWPVQLMLGMYLIALVNAGCYDGEYKIQFGSGFFAPFGLDTGSTVKIDWEFSPKGS